MRFSVSDVLECLSFYSRLPAPVAEAAPDLSRLAPSVPIAGAIIGALAGMPVFLSMLVGLPPIVAAGCAIAASALITGAFHEDGLADVADGFGGGYTREAKLEIMRDSRVGAFGALALCLMSVLRITSLGAVIEQGYLLAFSALLFISGLSRVIGLLPMVVLAPARTEGLAASTSELDFRVFVQALLVASFLALAPLMAGASFARLVVAFGAACDAVVFFTREARRQIGGYTGDVLGAAQQIAEVLLLMCFAAR